ncbi:Syntaxin-61 [Hondaea fermentalgiana]|uniref:Syntaxin-61 n=1 Tax=Hondaea fermentalgiana TaxID=2315210 RepID=A0A2R5GLA6_9STRA|nr:Syntaxin-61 [Hondaea fermentalgiana]|eukprot:GBG31692.1 Syntaxin-61 [Hondaea fermentalgiana]
MAPTAGGSASEGKSTWQRAAAEAERALRTAQTAVAHGWRDGADGGGAALNEAQVRLDDLDSLLRQKATAPVGQSSAQRTADRLRSEWSRLVGEFNARGGRVDTRTILAVQQTAVQQQDRSLDEIAEQLSRVGQIGRSINEEVTLQTGLLDDLETGMDEGVRRVGAANREAGDVADNGSTCRLWMTILVLTVVLVLLIVLG